MPHQTKANEHRLSERPETDAVSSEHGRKLTAWQWMFQSRKTGRLSIVAWPNLALWVWIAIGITRRLTPMDGWVDEVLVVAGTGALVVWAADELLRGVNPWRRLLGFAALISIAVSVAA